MDLHIYLHFDGLSPLMDAIQQGVTLLENHLTDQGAHMSAALDALTTEVSTTRGVMESALVLIQGFARRLDEAGLDEAKLDLLRQDLHQGESDLAIAVAENQPPLP